MAATARAPADRGQGHSDGPRRTIGAALSAVDTELENSGSGPSCRGRFLKVRDGNARGSQRCPSLGSAGSAGNAPGARSGPGSASRTRSSSVLSKVAQLESKIMSRKKQMELQSTELGLEPLDEESSSSALGNKRGAGGRNYLKSSSSTCGNGTRRDGSSEEKNSIQSPGKSVGVKQQLDLDSDEEEMRELLESSLGFSSGKGNQKVVVSDAQRGGKKNKTPVQPGRPPPSHRETSPPDLSKASFHTRDSEKSGFGRVNSPALSPTRNLSGHTMRSSLKDNTARISGTAYTKQSQESLQSDRSEIKSLDELFSRADDAEDPTSSSSNEFRLNVLSLDDLAPDITSEAEELKQKGEDILVTQESNQSMKRDPFLVEEDQADVDDASEGDVEKTISEAEISEHLSGVSTDFPGHKQDYLDQDERTLNSEYSEDFEGSVSPADRESVSSRAQGHSGESPSSARAAPGTRERHKRGQRVTVRDTGVQTTGPPFTLCWAKANTSAVPSPPRGTSYIDPVPIASRVVSTDALEALTAHSPSLLTLHALFKQHLMWTQQFVENIHHLHSALVESLEQDKCHYHTLEEAKEYIKNHKPPPLTLEQALEEIQRAQEE